MFEFIHLKKLLSNRRTSGKLRRVSIKMKKGAEKKIKVIEELEHAMQIRDGDGIYKHGRSVLKILEKEILEALDEPEILEKILNQHLSNLHDLLKTLESIEPHPNNLIEMVNREIGRVREISEEAVRNLSRVESGGSNINSNRALDEGSLINDLIGFSMQLRRVSGRSEKIEKKGIDDIRDIHARMKDYEGGKEQGAIDANWKKIEKRIKKMTQYLEKELELMNNFLNEDFMLISKLKKEVEQQYEPYIQKLSEENFRKNYARELLQIVQKTKEEIQHKFEAREKELKFIIGQTEHVKVK